MKRYIRSNNWSSNVAPYGEEIHFDTSKLKDFYGLRGIKVINVDAKHDPYIMYKKKIVDYHDVEDALWAIYVDECEENGAFQDETFFETMFVPKHRADAVEYIEALPAVAEITDDLSDWYTASIIKASCNSATSTCNITAKDPIELSNPIEAEDNIVDEENYEPYDYGFGMDSNGEYIDESTVEELCRIANEIVQDSDLSKIYSYPEVDPETFKDNYYMTGTYSGAYLDYAIFANSDSNRLDISDCMRSDWDRTFPDLQNKYTDKYDCLMGFTIHVKGDEIIEVTMNAEIQEDGRYDEYDTKNFPKAYDIEKICNKVAEDFEPIVKEIHRTVSNI